MMKTVTPFQIINNVVTSVKARFGGPFCYMPILGLLLILDCETVGINYNPANFTPLQIPPVRYHLDTSSRLM